MPTHSGDPKPKVLRRYGWWMVFCPDMLCYATVDEIFWSQDEAFRWAESHVKYVHQGRDDA
jgi:hypothetical protein